MSGLAVSLSDLDLARRLSRALCGVGGAAPRTEPLRPADFVRFSANRVQGHFEPPPATDAVAPLSFPRWDALLAWSLNAYPGRVGFVVDPSGFVIATHGEWEFAHLEGVGPQLLDLVRQAQKIEDAGRIRFAALHFDAFWLIGLYFLREGMGDFTVGFLGDEPMQGEARAAIALQVDHNLERL